MSLAGILCIRNGDRQDYSWREAGESLLGCCDELVICDCDSEDGTRQAIDAWAEREQRINRVNFPWTDPCGDNMWYPTWINYARQHAKSTHCIYLDADEILHENSYAEVLKSAREVTSLICQRFNFWRDAQSLIPHGHCCGHEVIRCAPQTLWVPSDYPDPRANEVMAIAVTATVQIMHYGFLRKREAFFLKARSVHRIWNGAGEFDSRLVSAEQEAMPWMENHKVSEWVNDLVPFTGTHPEIIKPWLKERGYKI